MTIGVVEALRRRRESGGPPFRDGLKIALVAEGGAMRGVFAGGMVSALEEEGFSDCFDLMAGSSAGACALAYFRAGQARFGTRMFHEDLNTGVFIRKRRVLSGGPAVSVDYLVDEVFRRIKPLDTDKLAGPGAQLFATAMDVDAAELVTLTGFETPDRAFEILRATTRMPLLSGAPVRLDGRRLLDGSLLSHVPVDAALRRGATHVLALLTRHAGAVGAARPSRADSLVGYRILRRRYGAALTTKIWEERAAYRQLLSRFSSGAHTRLGAAQIMAVAPDRAGPSVSRMTQSTRLLLAGARHGEARMKKALAGEHVDARYKGARTLIGAASEAPAKPATSPT